MTLMRCLECGSKISEEALIQLAKCAGSIRDVEALEEELLEVDPDISCHACDEEPYNLLVPACEWEDRREELQEAIVDHYLGLAKAADQNASKSTSDKARERFRKRSKKYRELAKEAR